MPPVWDWIVLLLLLLCTAGTILPVLPGLPLMALIIAGYGWLEGFEHINAWITALAVVFAAAGTLLDYLAGPYLAKRQGATKAGYWGVLIGGVGGIFIFGPLGLIIGPFIGALVGELFWGKTLKQASQIGVASLLGLLIGNSIKLILAAILIGVFVIRVFL